MRSMNKRPDRSDRNHQRAPKARVSDNDGTGHGLANQDLRVADNRLGEEKASRWIRQILKRRCVIAISRRIIRCDRVAVGIQIRVR